VLLPSGLAGTTWTHFHLIRQSSVLLYGFVVIALWHAPIYGWLLMISAWAKRAVFLWAFLPFALIGIVDKVAFNSNRFGKFLQYRLGGGFGRAFQFPPRGAVPNLPPLTPLRFLSTPGLWGGLLFTALFLAVAIRLRRNREPI
jgi:ABC-2 type transport system permease protein